MKSTKSVRGLRARAPLATAVAVALFAAPAAQAFEFQKGSLTGSFDTTVQLRHLGRAEDADPNLLGKSYFNPRCAPRTSRWAAIPAGNLGRCASSGGVPGSQFQIDAPGRFSVNRDDGNLKYDDGDAISNAFKITSELSLKWRSWGAFARATYFYDFENADRDDLTADSQGPDRRSASACSMPSSTRTSPSATRHSAAPAASAARS